jgi:hypothetical protein
MIASQQLTNGLHLPEKLYQNKNATGLALSVSRRADPEQLPQWQVKIRTFNVS